MASPRLESLCCINITDNKEHLIGTKAYNITCIISSSLSIIGAVYMLIPRQVPENARLRRSIGHERQIRIINWLTVADLLACIGILVRSCVWVRNYGPIEQIPEGNDSERVYRIFCAVVGAWIQYFYITTYFWTFSFAIDVFLLTRNKTSEMWLYHVLSWMVSAMFCIDGLIPLYYPSLSRCERKQINLIPHYIATLLPIVMVMIVNPILYFFSARKVSALLALMSGKYTDQERQVVKQTKEKFALIIAVFYICWTPNLVNSFIILTGSSDELFNAGNGVAALDVMMGILNPLQACLNALIYRGSNIGSKLRLPFHQNNIQTPGRRTEEGVGENSPLLSESRQLKT